MSGIDTVLHPTFEALSAHADGPDDVASATRVGRHVARCARCRAEVGEIRALGDAARAIVVAGAPTGLWSRIAAADSAPARGAGRLHGPTPADLPAPSSRRHRAVIAGAAVLGMAIAAVALWPRPAALQAAGPSRLTFSPRRPAAGGTVRVRYVPPRGTTSESRYVLVGRFAQPPGGNVPRYGGPAVDQLADSLAELTPTGDGAYVATMRLPSGFLALSLGVHHQADDIQDLDGGVPWMIIGGISTGEPSLSALLAAAEVRMGHDGYESARPHQAVDVADSLKRYFPKHPAGWALTRSYGVARGRFDLLRFFESAERKYTSMFEALWEQPALDAERLHDMVVFAHNIEEPDEVLRWAARFVDEHPEDPRALFDMAGAVHEIELRGYPATGDSVRRRLPALDRAYQRAPRPNAGYADARRLAEAYGDSATRALWIGRGAENGVVANIWLLTRRGRGSVADSSEAEVRRRALAACAVPARHLPLLTSIGEWRTRCELYRGVAYGYMSSATLADGRPKQALAEADSAVLAMHRGELCAPSRAYMAHAFAALALGDTTTAESDLVAGSAGYMPGVAPLIDTAQARLGARFDRAAAIVRLDSAKQVARACEGARIARRRAREQRRAE